MAKRRRLQFHVTGPARRDIATIVKRSLQEFGQAASLRYRALIRQALLDFDADPEQPGSKQRPEIMILGARTYHISLSRTRVRGSTLKDPRHFLLYRRREDGVIEVARVLHEGRDLQRHLPEGYRPDAAPI
ncbi:Plasmid stabilization system protein [Candidatus Sulfopaludibacter sp. SbA3]|nr:Plasmid stabilization system protein [Candidatus Sulfopaludibacter sp. SbA3]